MAEPNAVLYRALSLAASASAKRDRRPLACSCSSGMSFCRGSVNCRVSDGQMYDLCESSRSVEIFVGVGGGVGVRVRQRVSSINYQTARHADH